MDRPAEDRAPPPERRWEVRHLFERALDLPEEARGAFLLEECPGDEALRLEVEGLLDSAMTESFLEPPGESPVTRILAEQVAIAQAGSRIGQYTLRSLVATGGMGVVFEAEQQRPHRRVALKMLRLGLASSASRHRFRYETEVLARLGHPAIATIHDVGVHHCQGYELPWFAMELIEGASTIVAHATAKHQSIEARLKLFIDVCEAVHHGHQKGILHRDLKPSNILVDATGRVKVIDFGLARATDADLALTLPQTQHGQLLGTLHYMSPEQIDGSSAALDTRSDVYALGVVLFELLTGRLPYRMEDLPLPDIARTIRDAPPIRPSLLQGGLRGDLETILLTALEKPPERRYASAAALGGDLRRYLACEPIEARPPSRGYRLRMFARRNRVAVGSAALILLVMIGATLMSLRFAMESEKQRHAEAAARGRADALVQTLLDRSLVATFDFAWRIRDLAGAAPIQAEVIASAVEDLELLEQMAGDDRAVRLGLARAYTRLGDVCGNPGHPNLGDWEGALEGYRKAMSLAKSLGREEPDSIEVLALRSLCHRRLGEHAHVDRRYEEALEHYRAALLLADRMRAKHPGDQRVLKERSACHLRLANSLKRLARFKEAEPHFLRHVEIGEQLHRDHPSDRELRDLLGVARYNLAGLYLDSRQHERAAEGYRRSIEGFEAALEDDPDDDASRRYLAMCRLWCGYAESELGRLDRARESLQEAVRIFEHLTARDPENAQLPPLLAWSHEHLGFTWTREAQDTLGESRHAWDEGRSRFLRSAEVWDDLKKRGKLHPSHASYAMRMRENVSWCDAKLATCEADQ